MGLLVNERQRSVDYRWTSGRRYVVTISIPGIGGRDLTGSDGNTAIQSYAASGRIALTCDPGRGWSGDPYKQFAHPECFAPPQPGSKVDESPRLFAREPPINNVDLSIAKNLGIAR